MPYGKKTNKHMGAIVFLIFIEIFYIYIYNLTHEFELHPVLCYVKWQLFQSCLFCCNIQQVPFNEK